MIKERKKKLIYNEESLCAALARASPSCLSRFRKKMGKTNKTKVKYYTPIEQSSGYVARHSLHTHTQLIFIHIYIPILTFLHGDKRERQVLSVLPSLSFFFAWLHKLLSGDGFRQVTDPSFSFFLISFELIFFPTLGSPGIAQSIQSRRICVIITISDVPIIIEPTYISQSVYL
jgi:hypothetical protein